MKTKHFTPCLLSLFVLSACASLGRSDYVRPNVDLPATWQNASTQQSSPASAWWQAFNEPELDALIAQVQARNNNLAAAAIKLRRARLQAGLAADKANPSVAARLNNTQTRTLSEPQQSTRSNSATASVAWEADLWGRVAAQTDAARWEAEASEQDLASTALSLTTTTAQLYWQKAWLKQRIALAEQSIDYVSRIQELARKKYAAGAVSALDLFEAQQSLASQQASLVALQQQSQEVDTSLALLLDGPPGKTVANPMALSDRPLPEVEAGLPASLLARRPDLRAAELRLRSTLASGDASRLAYYPSLSLTGTLGTSSKALLDVLQNPVASLATQLGLPFLQWNEMQLTKQVTQADYELAVVNFRQTLYTALGDVENALSARSQYASQAELLQQSLAAAKAAEQRYEVRYRAGAATLQSWLDAQEKRRNAELALAENSYNRLNNHLTLIRALGGATQAGQT